MSLILYAEKKIRVTNITAQNKQHTLKQTLNAQSLKVMEGLR